MRWLVCVVVVALLSISSRRAFAQPAPKSPWVATGLALGVTLGGAGLGAVVEPFDDGQHRPLVYTALSASAVLAAVGPSAGHLYAGETRHAIRWSAIRGGGIALGVLGVGLAIDGFQHDKSYGFPAALLAGVGFGTYAVGLSWDLYDAHRAARSANSRVSARHVLVTPMVGDILGVGILGAF